MKLSVIIPIYNSEQTIRRCVDSLTEQINNDVELLLINDGSTDLSEMICREYEKQYSFIHCVTQKNRGVSVARNSGIEKAAGDYISFVDSDDYVEPEYISTILDYINNMSPDLISFRFKSEFDTTKHVYFLDDQEKIAYKYQELSKQQKMCSCVTTVYRKEIINRYHISFDKRLRIAEDETFVFLNVIHANSVLFSSDELYHIDDNNQDSLSRKSNRDLCEQLIIANRIMFDTIDSVDLSERTKQLYHEKVEWSFFRSAYSVCLEEYKTCGSFSSRIISIKNTCTVFVNEGIKPQSMKCRVMSLPIRLRLSILLYFVMMRKAR